MLTTLYFLKHHTSTINMSLSFLSFFFCSSEKCFFTGLLYTYCFWIWWGFIQILWSFYYLCPISIHKVLAYQAKKTNKKTITTSQKHKLSKRESTKQFNILKYFYSNCFLMVIKSQYSLHTFQSAVTFSKRKNYCLIQQKNG